MNKRIKKTEILERRYASKPVISDIVRGHRLTKEESDLVAIQDPVDTVDILIEPILTRRALNGFEAAVCAMKKEEKKMFSKNTERVLESGEWLYDVTVEVVDCLPFDNYKIKIKTTNVPELELGDYCDIDENEYTVIVKHDEAECIMNMPGAYYLYLLGLKNIETQCLCKVHIYDDHREIDLFKITSFGTLYHFLERATPPGGPYLKNIEGHIDMYHANDHMVLEEYASVNMQDEPYESICYYTNILRPSDDTYCSSVGYQIGYTEIHDKSMKLPITRYDFHCDGETIDIIDREQIDTNNYCRLKEEK